MRKYYLVFGGILLLNACTKVNVEEVATPDTEVEVMAARQESTTFREIKTIPVGASGAAEISAYDPCTKKLFVVNNSSGNNRIDVFNLADVNNPVALPPITTSVYGGFVNSISVSRGKLAAAIESNIKTNNGRVVVFGTKTYNVLANVEVGALPDMVTFSPDGCLIMTANEGEPNDDYSIDPVGTISIISVNNSYQVTTLGFGGFEGSAAALKLKGFRLFGKNASFAQDVEPEYVAIAANSKKAWVTLQENNAMAVVDLTTKTITDILPFGFKNYNLASNSIDASDEPSPLTPIVDFKAWPVKGMYLPDGIAVLPNNCTPFVFTANEGDQREYGGFNETRRVGNAAFLLDPIAFPNAADLKLPANLGRLNVTTTLGDTDNDGDFDELYSFGGRSFSIWHGITGQLLFDSRDILDKKAFEFGVYPNNRSDDKGSEPEGITIGRVGNKNLVFVGLERANAVAVFELSNPQKPVFLQWLTTGIAPEGVLFVPASQSPNGRSLLIVSAEGDGTIKIFTTGV